MPRQPPLAHILGFSHGSLGAWRGEGVPEVLPPPLPNPQQGREKPTRPLLCVQLLCHVSACVMEANPCRLPLLQR